MLENHGKRGLEERDVSEGGGSRVGNGTVYLGGRAISIILRLTNPTLPYPTPLPGRVSQEPSAIPLGTPECDGRRDGEPDAA